MLKVLLIGNIGQDATIVENNGNPFCKFSIAVNDNYKDEKGNVVEKTQWVNCVMGNAKHGVIPFLKKGTKVYVDGKLSAKLWKNDNGVVQLDLKCNVNTVELCSKKDDAPAADTNAGTNTGNGEAPVAETAPSNTVADSDDLPF